MHLFGNNSSMLPTPLWSVGKSIFLHDVFIYKHCIYKFINIVYIYL